VWDAGGEVKDFISTASVKAMMQRQRIFLIFKILKALKGMISELVEVAQV
jgi:hypothetical protein